MIFYRDLDGDCRHLDYIEYKQERRGVQLLSNHQYLRFGTFITEAPVHGDQFLVVLTCNLYVILDAVLTLQYN